MCTPVNLQVLYPEHQILQVAASGFTTQSRKYVSGNSNYSSGRSVSYDTQEQQYVR